MPVLSTGAWRSLLYALSPKGLRALDHINKAAASCHRKVLKTLSPEDVSRRRKFLQELRWLAVDAATLGR